MRTTGCPAFSSASTAASWAGVRRTVEPKVREQAVRAVDVRATEGLPVDGDDPLAHLAGRFGEELLQPGPELARCPERR